MHIYIYICTHIYIYIYIYILILNLWFLLIRCKERGVVIGMTGRVRYCQGDTIFIQNSSNEIIPHFAAYCEGQKYFPIVPAYASTVHKIMAQTLQHITLVFDIRILSPAIGYVPLLRVSSLDNVVLLLRLRKSHFLNFLFCRVSCFCHSYIYKLLVEKLLHSTNC